MHIKTAFKVAQAGARTPAARAVYEKLYQENGAADARAVAVETLRDLVGDDPAGLADVKDLEETLSRMEG